MRTETRWVGMISFLSWRDLRLLAEERRMWESYGLAGSSVDIASVLNEMSSHARDTGHLDYNNESYYTLQLTCVACEVRFPRH